MTDTGAEVRVEWGFNRWALVEAPHGRSVQRQVAKPAELAAAIQEVADLPWDEARATAERLWHERPRDAGAEQARARSSLVAATGVSQRALALGLVAFIVFWLLVLKFVF